MYKIVNKYFIFYLFRFSYADNTSQLYKNNKNYDLGQKCHTPNKNEKNGWFLWLHFLRMLLFVAFYTDSFLANPFKIKNIKFSLIKNHTPHSGGVKFFVRLDKPRRLTILPDLRFRFFFNYSISFFFRGKTWFSSITLTEL